MIDRGCLAQQLAGETVMRRKPYQLQATPGLQSAVTRGWVGEAEPRRGLNSGRRTRLALRKWRMRRKEWYSSQACAPRVFKKTATVGWAERNTICGRTRCRCKYYRAGQPVVARLQVVGRALWCARMTTLSKRTQCTQLLQYRANKYETGKQFPYESYFATLQNKKRLSSESGS